VHQQQSRKYQVKRVTGDLFQTLHTSLDKRALPIAFTCQNGKRFRAQLTVEVDPHDPTGRPYTLSHQAHNFARPTSNVQTLHAKTQANPV
jgi:hypothetical protein